MWSAHPQVRAAILVSAGMVILFLGVLAGSLTGALLRGDEPQSALLGLENASETGTTFTANTATGAVMHIRQPGTGTGLRADSARGNGAIVTAELRDRSGLIAQNNASEIGGGAAVQAQGNRNAGLRATSQDSAAVVARSPVMALYADGNGAFSGDVTVVGTCTGCGTAILAVNAGTSTLVSGNVLTVLGVGDGPFDEPVLLVGAAGAGDTVVGIVDVALTERRVPGQTRDSLLQEAGESIGTGQLLRIVTAGVAYPSVDSATQFAVGEPVVAGATPGYVTTVRGTPSAGQVLGYALGEASGGRVAVFVDPH